MKLYSLLLAVLLATPMFGVASDPFVGTWVWNSEKSPKPVITYGIKDLGGERYALTGSSGQTTEIKADGVAIKSPTGATVSFKKLDAHTWQMDRVESGTLKRTYTVSEDDRTLTLVDVVTMQNGRQETTTVRYARTGPGKSLFGEWRSVSMKDTSSGPAYKLVIETYDGDGLRLTQSNQHRTEMKFDGKRYFEIGPDGIKGDSSSGKRVSATLIEMEEQVKGTPDSRDEFRVSEDGKTLTIVNRPIKMPGEFTSVWDKE